MGEDWTSTAFRDEAVAWVDDRLARLGRERTGDVEQPHVRPWATVMRVPTADGPVWFKANAGPFRHEPHVVDRLAARVPERVPPLLARDLDRGWLLLSDAGERLREVVAAERSLAPWHDVLSGLADLHHALEDDVDALVAAGVPDRRLAVLVEQYADLVARDWVDPRFRDTVGLVRDLVAEVASYGVAETVQHDDLHDGQVYVREGRTLVLDWGDAVASHPFFTLSVTVQGHLAWGLDDEEGSEDTTPYLETYLARYAPERPELAAVLPAALRLGWASRALNQPELVGPDGTHARLSMFLDGRV